MNCSFPQMPGRHPYGPVFRRGATLPRVLRCARAARPGGAAWRSRALAVLWLLAAIALTPPVLAADRSLPVATLGDAVASGRVPRAVVDLLGRDGIVPVIVRVALPATWAPEPTLTGAQVEQQRLAIASAQLAIVGELAGLVPKPPRRLRTTPYLSAWVDAKALAQLVRSRHVARVLENGRRPPALANSGVAGGVTPVQNGLGLLGSGQTIVIIDSGVDSQHPFLGGRVVSEACFSEDGGLFSSVFGACPNGADSAFGAGSGAPCQGAGCSHGTLVAGIAAGAPFGRVTLSGVASNANLVSMQVFHIESDPDDCGTVLQSCIMARDSDVLQALERAFELRQTLSIAAVNLSLGSGRYTDRATCDDDTAYPEAIANLVAADIAVVAASGNAAIELDDDRNVIGFSEGIAAPACVTGAIAVGSLSSAGAIASSSQTGLLLSLLAVGDGVLSSVPGAAFARASGTSLAAPQVSGAIAALAGLDPQLATATLQRRIEVAGVPTRDTRTAPARVRSRLRLDEAVEQQEGRPLPPSGVRVISAAGRSLRIAWVDNARSERSHRLYARRPGSTLPERTVIVTGAGVATGLLDALVANTEYEVTVQACDAYANCSLPSMRLLARTPNTLPSAPIGVQAVEVTTNTIDLQWRSTSTNPVTAFRIGHDTRGPWRVLDVPANIRRQPFINLQPGQRYNFWIEAVNADGASARVSLSATTLPAGPPPATPTDLRVCTANLLDNACFANFTRLLWRDAAGDEASYEFELAILPPGTDVNSAPWQRAILPANTTTRDLTLLAGLRYAFRVRACSALQVCSPYSNTLVYTKP